MGPVFQSAALAAGVSIGDNFYSPPTTTVQAGQTVTWTYSTGSSFHTVTANNGAFDSSPGCPANPGSCMNPGDSYSHTFTTLGTFGYHCKVHGLAMSGTIVVVAAATTSPGSGTSPLPGPASHRSTPSLARASAAALRSLGTCWSRWDRNAASSDRASASRRWSAGFLTRNRPDSCSTSRRLSERTTTSVAPSSPARRSPATTARYSATLFVAGPI